MDQPYFEQRLLDALKKKYGRKPTARQLSQDLYKVSDGQVNVSGESVRKWLTGLSVPRGSNLSALMQLLDNGTPFSEKQTNFSSSLVQQNRIR